MWPTDRFRRKSGDAAPPSETPLVLIGRDGRRRVVLAADAAAHAAGLRIGMSASKAISSTVLSSTVMRSARISSGLLRFG